MKNFIISRVASSPSLQKIVRKAVQLYHTAVSRNIEKQVRALTNNTVIDGPFMGMVYPELSSSTVHTSITPKLLGIYENEIYEAVESLLGRHQYSRIVDIGAAEGYYAAGFAKRAPSAEVIAFEADKGLATSLKAMCKANDVHDRVTIKGYCNPEDLAALGSSSRTLLLCDCEGGEIDLIQQESIAALGTCDYIVECHDMYVHDCTSIMSERLSGSHNVRVITSKERTLSDIPKPLFAQLKGRPDDIEYGIGEHRHFTMNWVVAEIP